MKIPKQHLLGLINIYLGRLIDNGKASVSTTVKNNNLCISIAYGNKTTILPFDDSAVDYAKGFADAYEAFVCK